MKKQPLRMCIACREMRGKSDMCRVVKNADGGVFVDPTGKAAGRGAYLCGGDVCTKKLTKQKLLNRVFSCEVSKEVYDELLRLSSEKAGNQKAATQKED